MNNTGIGWTMKTWNPTSGCEEVSPGCKFCYAEFIAEKFRGKAFPNGFELTYRPHKLAEPKRLKKPTLIFVNSMSDLFWEAIPDAYRDRIIDVIEDTPRHQYQVLTKRPEEMLRYSRRRKLPANLWAGTTVESTHTSDRVDILRQVDAPIRFISAEPLLDDLGSILNLEGVQWLISGGESGRHLLDPALRERRALVTYKAKCWTPRSDRIDWIRRLRDNCGSAGTAFFYKQWGGLSPKSGGRELDERTWDEYPMQVPGK